MEPIAVTGLGEGLPLPKARPGESETRSVRAVPVRSVFRLSNTFCIIPSLYRKNEHKGRSSNQKYAVHALPIGSVRTRLCDLVKAGLDFKQLKTKGFLILLRAYMDK